MKNVSMLFLGVVALAACNSSTPGVQTISGQAALSTFPAPLTEVQAVQGAKVAARAAVASDGAFSLQIPTGAGYRLQFVNANGHVALVFPRTAGAIDSRFDIRASEKAFNLGQVRYVGDPAAQTFAFTSVSATGTDTDTDTDDVQCEDGIDAVTGAVCVDDEDDEGAGACEADGESADGDDVNCEDGIDPATGLECNGGPAANTDDGTEAATEEDERVPFEAAVPEHNLPAAMGCASDADNDDINCEDGIDPATGLECEGGPAANPND